MTITTTNFNRRKNDNGILPPRSQLFFIFPSQCEREIEESLSVSQSLSLTEFTHSVSEVFSILIKTVQKVSGSRIAKQQQFANMLAALDGMEETMDMTLSHVSETKLMAFNTLINASRCGFKAQTLVGVINEMTQVCHQSEKYLSSAKQSIADVRDTITNVKALVAATVENDMSLFSVIKSQVDHHLGRLSASEELLSLMLSSQGHEEHDHSPAQPKLCEKLQEDVVNLGQVLQTAQRYLSRLLNRLSRDGVSTVDLAQAQAQLKMLSRVELIIKIS